MLYLPIKVTPESHWQSWSGSSMPNFSAVGTTVLACFSSHRTSISSIGIQEGRSQMCQSQPHIAVSTTVLFCARPCAHKPAHSYHTVHCTAVTVSQQSDYVALSWLWVTMSLSLSTTAKQQALDALSYHCLVYWSQQLFRNRSEMGHFVHTDCFPVM